MKSIRSSALCMIVVFAFSPLWLSSPLKAQLPEGFVQERLVGNLNPTTMAVAPDGRIFIAEKNGKILILQDDELLSLPFLDIEVDHFNERGLTGLAFDPHFEHNNYLYIFYTVPDANFNRVSRVTANGNEMLQDSELPILDMEPLAGTIHNGGAMQFGEDGKLYICTGDGADPSNSQNLNNLLGKVLRINSDGNIPDDNPFYDDLEGNNRAIYAYGFRNPFTFHIDKNTQRMFLNDVGGSLYEEVNDVLPGRNYGWPLIEGFRTSESSPPHYMDPLYAYGHDEGCAIVASTFYDSDSIAFPDEYIGKYFFGDYCDGYIKVLDPENGEVIETFITDIDRPVAIENGMDGSLYYLERAGMGGGSPQDNTESTNGAIWKVMYIGDGHPFISRHPENQLISLGEPAVFRVAANGQHPLNYQWFKNGEEIEGQNEATLEYPSATLDDDGAEFFVVVHNDVGSDTSRVAVLSVTDRSRPELIISAPVSNDTFAAGDTLFFEGYALNHEGDTLATERLTWWIDLHHDDHTHPALATTSGISQGTYATSRRDHSADTNIWFRIYLRASDEMGLTSISYVEVFPRLTTLRFVSEPEGALIRVDGRWLGLPAEFESIEGMDRQIEIPDVMSDEGSLFLFQESDLGNERNFTFRIPEQDSTLTFFYHVRPPGDGVGLRGNYYSNTDREFEGLPDMVRVDPVIDFDWGEGGPEGISEDFFTIRWTGYLVPPVEDQYTLYTQSDDGVRVWVNDELVLDHWVPQAETEWSTSLWLEGESKLRIEYFELTGQASMRLLWSSPVVPKQVIPSHVLHPGAVTSEELLTKKESLRVYPNPMAEKANVVFQAERPGEVQMTWYNKEGKKMQSLQRHASHGENKWELDTQSFPKGLYILLIQQGPEVWRKTLIK